MNETVLIFVYGTLLEGETNHALLGAAGEKVVGAWVAGSLWDTGSGYPALSIGEDAGIVYGEVYRIDAGTLEALDELEDYYGPGDPRNEYERIPITAQSESVSYQAWTYVYPAARAAGLVRIAGGDWRSYASSR